MGWKRWMVAIAAFGLVAAASVGCNRSRREAAEPDGTKLARVKLLLNWFPEAEHGGFYAAQVHGFYRKAGLDVEIVPGGPGSAVAPRVDAGDVHFGVDNADNVLLARAQGAEVVALAAPIQTSPRCIMVHEESGIKRLQDLQNLTLAMNAGGAFSHYLKRHVPLKGVTIVPYTGSVARFVTDKRYAQQGYVFSEPFVARQQGAQPRCLLLADIGFDPYTSCLLTSERLSREKPDLVRRFVLAALQGWEQYLKDPARTHERIHELNPEMGLDVLDFGWKALKDLVDGRANLQAGLGHMSAERWNRLLEQLVEIEIIPAGSVDASRAFTTQFLPKSDDK